MENGPFIDGLPFKTSIDKGFSMAMLNIQMICHQQKLLTLGILEKSAEAVMFRKEAQCFFRVLKMEKHPLKHGVGPSPKQPPW